MDIFADIQLLLIKLILKFKIFIVITYFHLNGAYGNYLFGIRDISVTL